MLWNQTASRLYGCCCRLVRMFLLRPILAKPFFICVARNIWGTFCKVIRKINPSKFDFERFCFVYCCYRQRSCCDSRMWFKFYVNRLMKASFCKRGKSLWVNGNSVVFTDNRPDILKCDSPDKKAKTDACRLLPLSQRQPVYRFVRIHSKSSHKCQGLREFWRWRSWSVAAPVLARIALL